MTTTHTTATVEERIRHIINLRRMTQAEFARRIGIDPGNLSKHLSGKLPITEGLINKIVVDMGVSKTWLTTGRDVPFPKPSHARAISFGQIDTENAAPQGVPVYDIDVTAGFGQLSPLFTEDRIVGAVILPNLPESCRIVRVSGDSMTPAINNGSLIAIRELPSTSATIFWGQMYVVVMEDYRMVKRLKPDPENQNRLILHSDNPRYDDMSVDRDDIIGMYIVEAVLNFSLH